MFLRTLLTCQDGFSDCIHIDSPFGTMDEAGLKDVEDRFKATRDWEGRTYQRYSLEREINLAPIDDV